MLRPNAFRAAWKKLPLPCKKPCKCAPPLNKIEKNLLVSVDTNRYLLKSVSEVTLLEWFAENVWKSISRHLQSDYEERKTRIKCERNFAGEDRWPQVLRSLTLVKVCKAAREGRET